MTNALWRVVTDHATTDYTSKEQADTAAEQADHNGTLTAYQLYNQFTGEWDDIPNDPPTTTPNPATYYEGDW